MNPTSKLLYMSAELKVRDTPLLQRYSAAAQPMLRAHGGKVLAVSFSGADTIEGDPTNALHLIQLWPSRIAFDTFWASPEYAAIKPLRHAACDSRITVFESS